MIGAIVGALMGFVGLTSLTDALTGGNVTGWFFETVGSVVVVLLRPLFDLFCTLYDSIIAIVRNFIT